MEAERAFNLQKDRLIRGQILRLADDDQILLLTLHHIASDGWSKGVLMRELTTLYNAFCEERPSPLAPLPIQYADYALWQREWLRGEALEKLIDYWKDKLAGAPPVLDLPTDRPRAEADNYRGAMHPFLLSEHVSESVRQISRQERATQFMVLLAAFKILLYRLTAQTDLVVGTDLANRNQPETEGLIGFFLNHLVLRTDLSGDPSFREVVRRVRATALGAYTHQELPFDMLVEALRPERSINHAPVFQTLFVVDNIPRNTTDFAGLSHERFVTDFPVSKFDLALFMGDRQEEMTGLWVYRTDLFEASSIMQISVQFAALLAELLAHPDLPVADIDLRSESERAAELEAAHANEACLRGARRRRA